MGLSATTLASLERDHRRSLYAVPKAREQKLAQERDSDEWPAFTTELSEAEIRIMIQKNSPARVLWQAMSAIAYSVGLVVGLMALLAALGVR